VLVLVLVLVFGLPKGSFRCGERRPIEHEHEHEHDEDD
jgi:hypothetical protein